MSGSGFGSQGFGSSPYGIGVPSVGNPPGGAVLRDPLTGTSSGSRRIDPVTRDYVLDDNGRTLGMSDVQQLVLMALQTVRNSSAMNGLGQSLGDIVVIGDNIERQIASIFENALAHLVARGLVQIISTTVTRLHPGAIKATVRWRDLTTSTEHTSEI